VDDGERSARVLQVAAAVATRDGGPTTAILNINRSLRRRGHEPVALTTTADGPHARLAVDAAAPHDLDGALVWFCRRSRPHLLKNSWQLAGRARRLARSVDVVHIHGVYLANSVWGFVAAQRAGVPYVVQPHGTYEPYQEARHRRRKRLFNALIGNRIIESASALVAASEIEAANLRRRWPGARVVVVPPGFAHPLPEPTPAASRLDAWLAQPRERRVVFLGRLTTKKRPELLVDAWNAVREPGHLLVVGPPGEWRPAQLARRLDGGRDRSATFCSGVTPAQVAWILERAGIFVLPSENENFGIAVIEAMSHGCAVVTTDQTAASAHVREAASGVVLPEPHVELLTEALEKLLALPDTVAQLGELGRGYAAHTLTWDATARRLAALYNGILPARTSSTNH
jgi:glycosyltransferase involved in cell wall biosynthesis